MFVLLGLLARFSDAGLSRHALELCLGHGGCFLPAQVLVSRRSKIRSPHAKFYDGQLAVNTVKPGTLNLFYTLLLLLLSVVFVLLRVHVAAAAAAAACYCCYCCYWCCCRSCCHLLLLLLLLLLKGSWDLVSKVISRLYFR